ncbi:MAG: DUF4118 domain-containing protein [Pyrinomonadaceae bacterium]
MADGFSDYRNWLRYLAALFCVGLTTGVLVLLHPLHNTATVGIVFLLLILFIATFIGRNPALLASFAAVGCFNFFFIPPVRTWTISEPQNWVAWISFTVTAITVGELSAYAKRRAEEAERRKEEVKQLYNELQIAFEKASETEALRRSEKLKTALLDAVTHDLRTPLTSIKASITTLLESESPDRAKSGIELDAEGRQEFLEVIDEETDRLNNFIEAMVELAKIESRELELRTNWSSLSEIIENALGRAEKILGNRRVTVDLENGLPLVRVDEKALAEVFYTLLDNAAQYSPDGTRIDISARRNGEETVAVAVSDEGRGIPPEWREKIFDKFFRVENKIKTLPRSRGTGLGLAIARGLIEAHGGEIRAEENPSGRGARIVFTLPIGEKSLESLKVKR